MLTKLLTCLLTAWTAINGSMNRQLRDSENINDAAHSQAGWSVSEVLISGICTHFRKRVLKLKKDHNHYQVTPFLRSPCYWLGNMGSSETNFSSQVLSADLSSSVQMSARIMHPPGRCGILRSNSMITAQMCSCSFMFSTQPWAPARPF